MCPTGVPLAGPPPFRIPQHPVLVTQIEPVNPLQVRDLGFVQKSRLQRQRICLARPGTFRANWPRAGSNASYGGTPAAIRFRQSSAETSSPPCPIRPSTRSCCKRRGFAGSHADSNAASQRLICPNRRKQAARIRSVSPSSAQPSRPTKPACAVLRAPQSSCRAASRRVQGDRHDGDGEHHGDQQRPGGAEHDPALRRVEPMPESGGVLLP